VVVVLVFLSTFIIDGLVQIGYTVNAMNDSLDDIHQRYCWFLSVKVDNMLATADVVAVNVDQHTDDRWDRKMSRQAA